MDPITLTLLIQVLVGVGMEVLGYLLMPKPKNDPSTVEDMQNPTADAGRPLPVVFGEIKITGPNIIWWGDKYTNSYNVK